jgi:hypothetical protein
VHGAAWLWHKALSVVPAAGVIAGEVPDDVGVSRQSIVGHGINLPASAAPLIPLHCGNTLVITLDGQAYELTTQDPAAVLETLNGFLTRYDPDLLCTDYGDTAILPQLLALARRHGVRLALDRDPMPIRRRIVMEGRSSFTYGWMLYHPPRPALVNIDTGGELSSTARNP